MRKFTKKQDVQEKIIYLDRIIIEKMAELKLPPNKQLQLIIEGKTGSVWNIGVFSKWGVIWNGYAYKSIIVGNGSTLDEALQDAIDKYNEISSDELKKEIENLIEYKFYVCEHEEGK